MKIEITSASRLFEAEKPDGCELCVFLFWDRWTKVVGGVSEKIE